MFESASTWTTILSVLSIGLAVATIYFTLRLIQEQKRQFSLDQITRVGGPKRASLTRIITSSLEQLEFRRKQRRRRIEHDLPDVLDLLRICIDAGQDLRQAMRRVADEVRETSPVLSTLLNETELQINAGASRSVAYDTMVAATGSRHVKNLMNSLMQAEQLGSSLSLVLRTYATELRTLRRYKAEELGAKLSIKLIFPLILCLFPAMLIVLAGPSLLAAVSLLKLIR